MVHGASLRILQCIIPLVHVLDTLRGGAVVGRVYIFMCKASQNMPCMSHRVFYNTWKAIESRQICAFLNDRFLQTHWAVLVMTYMNKSHIIGA